MKKVVFLDRDGVVNKEVNYLHKIEDFEFTPNCIEALQTFIAKGFELAIVTNQAGLAKGYYSLDAYQKLTDYYVEVLGGYGICFLSIQYCPHHSDGIVSEYSVKCKCRKPEPGMILEVKKKFDVDLGQSLLVGDKSSDALAGKAAGIERVFLVETGHKLQDSDYDKFFVFSDLLGVAQSV